MINIQSLVEGDSVFSQESGWQAGPSASSQLDWSQKVVIRAQFLSTEKQSVGGNMLQIGCLLIPTLWLDVQIPEHMYTSQ